MIGFDWAKAITCEDISGSTHGPPAFQPLPSRVRQMSPKRSHSLTMWANMSSHLGAHVVDVGNVLGVLIPRHVRGVFDRNAAEPFGLELFQLPGDLLLGKRAAVTLPPALHAADGGGSRKPSSSGTGLPGFSTPNARVGPQVSVQEGSAAEATESEPFTASEASSRTVDMDQTRSGDHGFSPVGFALVEVFNTQLP